MDIKKRKSFISVRGGFSDTTGIAPCNIQMQFNEFDDKTRILISNKLFSILEFFFNNSMLMYEYKGNASNDFCKEITSSVFGQKNSLPPGRIYQWEGVFNEISVVICEALYNEVLDIVWFSCDWLKSNFPNLNKETRHVYVEMNSLFEQEYVGYRFVNGKIVAITDRAEIDEIEEACAISIKGCKFHIENAVSFLSDREKKDYKNCIKESISAVETMCQIITGDTHATLGTALKKLKSNGINIHQALESAFLKLYGYTSDEGGIRHCEGLFVSNVTFEEAKFMLVSCSAFVNYLIAEYGKQNS